MTDLYFSKDDKTFLEANQVASKTVSEVELWCHGVSVIEHDAFDHDQTYVGINVPTKQGMQRAQETDWIIKREEGDFVILHQVQFDELFTVVKW